jgi:hypothetical protein
MNEETVLSELRALPNMIKCLVPDGKDLERVFGEEAESKTSSGMPLDNRALTECMGRSSHIFAVFRGEFDPIPYVSVQMEDPDGNIVGQQIPISERPRYEGREDLVWLSDDFWMSPTAMGGEIKVVLVPQHLTVIGGGDGASDPVAMYPSPPADRIVREVLGVGDDPATATAVIGYN